MKQVIRKRLNDVIESFRQGRELLAPDPARTA